ncbi:MAG: hypothetical protein HUJ63_13365 [Enterococcus sp.]|nr:hypothetical protein [Enterococcus sp.]
MKYLTKHFSLWEFVKNCDANFSDSQKVTFGELYEKDLTILAVSLEKIRELINEPIIINSGLRSAQHNANVGGVATSWHVKGRAADIRVKNLSANFVYKKICACFGVKEIRKGYAENLHYEIIEYANFVHFAVKTRSN